MDGTTGAGVALAGIIGVGITGAGVALVGIIMDGIDGTVGTDGITGAGVATDTVGAVLIAHFIAHLMAMPTDMVIITDITEMDTITIMLVLMDAEVTPEAIIL